MADDTQNVVPSFPGSDIDVVFTDGVASISWENDVVKLYLSRIMPDIKGGGTVQPTVSHQIVITRAGFFATVAFISRQVARMVDLGYVTQQELDALIEQQKATEHVKAQ